MDTSILTDEHLQNYIGKIAEKFYEEYTEVFRSNATDYDDLRQEANLAMLETMNKYQNKFDDFSMKHKRKLLTMGVVWHFKHLLRDYIKLNECCVSYPYSESQDDELSIFYIDNDRSFELKLMIEDLRSILDKKAFEIVYKYLVENKSFREIGAELGKSGKQIKNIFDANLLKLKEIAKKEELI